MTTHCAGLPFKLGQTGLEYEPVRKNLNIWLLHFPLNRKTSLCINSFSSTLPSLCSSSVYFLIVYFTCLSDAAYVIVESTSQMIETCVQFPSFARKYEIVWNSRVPQLFAIACKSGSYDQTFVDQTKKIENDCWQLRNHHNIFDTLRVLQKYVKS